MIGRFEKTEEIGTTAETAPPGHVTRNPRVVDFEKLLSELSASFIRVSVEEIDSQIELWLKQIVLAMDVDRATVAELEPADGALCVTHQWAREGVSTPDKGSDVKLRFPWTANKLVSGELVTISQIDEFPPDAVEELSYA